MIVAVNLGVESAALKEPVVAEPFRVDSVRFSGSSEPTSLHSVGLTLLDRKTAW